MHFIKENSLKKCDVEHIPLSIIFALKPNKSI